MANQLENGKSCGSQLFEGLPQENWELDRLAQYACTQHDAISEGESSLAQLYWRLGLALNLARQHFNRGQWGRFLEDLGIDRTRASKARAIHCTFDTEDGVEGLSVQEAYRRRKRKPRKSGARKRRKRREHHGMDRWLLEVCKMADFFLDEASCVKPDEATSLLPPIEAAVEGLTLLRERVRQQATKT